MRIRAFRLHRPRNPLARAGLMLAGLALLSLASLLVLMVASVAALLFFGRSALLRWQGKAKPVPMRAQPSNTAVIEGEYRVIDKPGKQQLPAA